ncbi:MAG TPA: mechanosensitive ion channel domain-containing protein [Rhizomicrobium sp.]|nr:mechanosensitive ion channel domain-containing protein [Rhizomicrobium sp.]
MFPSVRYRQMPSVEQANQSFLVQLQVLLVNGGIRFLAAIAILVIGWILATYIKRWIQAGLERIPFDETLKPLLASLFRYAVLVLTFVLVLGQFGVQTTGLIAVLGAAGLAIGLALQGTLSNVAAGVMLLILRPFRVGHYIQASGHEGTVREIGLFTSILVTRDSIYVSIPNSAIFGGTIVNYTREPYRRINFTVAVDFANDLDAIEAAITEAVVANKHVLKKPEPWIGVSALHEYSVLLFVRAHVVSRDYWQALPSLQKDVKRALDKSGALIAVPRQAPAVRKELQSRHNSPSTDENFAEKT